MVKTKNSKEVREPHHTPKMVSFTSLLILSVLVTKGNSLPLI